MTLKFHNPKRTERNNTMYNYNNTINTNNTNKMEENKMNEIRMASILNKLDKSGVKVGFGPKVTAGGIGLIIEGEKETPELMELVNYLSQNPREGASLIHFCKNCLLAGNIPIRELSNGIVKYFICTNGKILVRTGEDFEVVYEDVVLPDLDRMTDRQIIDVLEASVETYENLTTEEDDYEDDYEEEEDYEDEEEDYDEEEEEEIDNYPNTYLDPELEEWTINYLSKKIKETHDLTALLKLDVIKSWLSEAQQGNPTSIKELKSLRKEVDNDWNF